MSMLLRGTNPHPGDIDPPLCAREPFADRLWSPKTPSVHWRIADSDYALLRRATLDLLAIDLAHYRTQHMERRLATLLERRQATSWAGYVERLHKDGAELRAFQDYLTINVSSFYRDAERWDYLRHALLPALIRERLLGGIQAWSAGCSMGAEPFTLAMLLQEEALSTRHSIWGTDIDGRVLAMAEAGGPYSENDLRELPGELRRRYMRPENGHLHSVLPSLRAQVDFAYFDLVRDNTTHIFDLVICRNVVIYFTPTIKRLVFERLGRSLRRGGILFIGSTETIPQPRRLGFEYIAPSFYRSVE